VTGDALRVLTTLCVFTSLDCGVLGDGKVQRVYVVMCITEYKQRISHGKHRIRSETQMVSENVSFLILLIINFRNCSKTIAGVNIKYKYKTVCWTYL
jgi:hypothetical protein